MKFKNCPNCKSSISNETEICPNCNFLILKKKDDFVNARTKNFLIYTPILGIVLFLVKCFAITSSQPSRMDIDEINYGNNLPNSSLEKNNDLAVPINPYEIKKKDSALNIEKKYNSLNNNFRVFVVDKLDEKSKKEYSDIADHLDKENIKFEDFYREMLYKQENNNSVANAQQDPYQAVVKADKILLELQQKYNISDEDLKSIIILFLENKNAKLLVTAGH